MRFWFGERGDVKAPGHCKWCGKKLRKKFDHVKDDAARAGYRKLETFKLGDYGDGHFCGLNCGYAFGRQLADLGRLLVPVKKKGDAT